MRKVALAALLAAALTALATGSFAIAKGGGGERQKNHWRETLDGWQEVPSQITTGRGEFRARVVDGGNRIEYWLSYEGLEGDAAQAHIHIGSHHENGGIAAWLCGGGVAQPPCPTRAGEIHWWVDREDIIPNAQAVGQGQEPGNMEDLLRAMRNNEAYVNVHSPTRAPGGEIRADFGHDRRH